MNHCPRVTLPTRTFDAQARVLKALADPHRLKMLATLSRAPGEVCVCDFTDGLPLNQPTVSHHLGILRAAGLVRSDRRGTWSYYRLDPKARRLVDRALAPIFRGIRT
jgi:ArsR family transcriptional regulator, arsenate/arsenite/antimonite-responsive transcriptional repressor